MSTFDCIVIGSGPGGYVAAIRAAQLGLRTAVVEREATVGGRCLNYACIPAKAVLRSADILSEVREAGEFGIRVAAPEVDFGAIAKRRGKVVKTLTGGVSGLLKKHAVEVIRGEAALTPEGGVWVGDEVHEATRGVILATGSVKRAVPGMAFGGRVIGTEEAWALDALPASLAVVGAGASGAEIASAYARLGTRVQLFEALSQVLPAEDAEIAKVAQREFTKQGIEVHVETLVTDVVSGPDAVTFTHGGTAGSAELLAIAVGRAPDVEPLGLAAAGIALTASGLVQVDGAGRTSHPLVWAVGDLVPGPALAHKASDEGIIAAEAIAGLATHPLAHVDIPRATFCAPNVGSFGLTEEQARAAGHDVVVGRVPYGAVGAGTVYGDRSGVIKVIGDATHGDLLGGHIVGTRATDLIQQLVDAKAAEAGYADVARMVHGHPTLSEGVMEAARDADGWLVHG